jgi:hypothetical protein
MIDLGELKVPKALRPVAEEIVRMTDSVCVAVLDKEYADLARRGALLPTTARWAAVGSQCEHGGFRGRALRRGVPCA